MYDYLNSRLKALEDRWGVWVVGGVVGLMLFAAACVFVRPGYQTETGLGKFYAELACHPFTTFSPNPVGFRFLTPLLSWVVGLRCGDIFITNLILACLFIMAVYWCFRRLTPDPADALIAASTISFSLVTLTTVYYSGFCDSLTYILIFFMWWCRRQGVVFWLLFLLGMFNRESVAFLIPWFLFLRLTDTEKKWRTITFDAVAILTVAAIVWRVRGWQSDHMQINLTASYYLSPLRDDCLFFFRPSFPESILGFSTVFRALWAIPVVAGIYLWRGGQRREIFGWVVLFLCSAAQLFIAWDSSRLFTMSFMIVITALPVLFGESTHRYRYWIVPLLLMNFLLPAYYTAGHEVEHMRLLPDTLYRVLFLSQGW